MTRTATGIPVFDARGKARLTESAVQEFRQSGLLIMQGVIAGQELARLQAETEELIAAAVDGRPDDPDFLYRDHAVTGERVPFRIEYVIDKSPAVRSLVAHPFLLQTMVDVCGEDAVASYDSMVFKLKGAGAAIPWHRDMRRSQAPWEAWAPGTVINVDVYLDRADESTCLWGIPGSNNWSDADVDENVAKLSEGGFHTDGTVPIPMEPGDVLLHNVTVLHGSPATSSDMRRVIYFGVAPAHIEAEYGPHNAEFAALKRRALLASVEQRRTVAYAANEEITILSGDAPLGVPLEFRTLHESYWTWPRSFH